MIHGNHISEEDLALYAMRSLAPPEAAGVQQHLNTCGECRSKLADILGELSLVALTVPQEPVPPEVRERFLQKIRSETAVNRHQTVKPAQESVRSGNWFSGLGWIAAAAALLFAAYMGNTAHNLRKQIESQRDQVSQLSSQVSHTQQILDVLTSRTAKRVALTEVKAAAMLPAAHVIYEKDKGSLIFIASDLHPLQANKTYELWLIPTGGAAPIPAGLFRPDANGSASVVFPPLPAGVEAKAFGVTVEQAQGATTPTLPIVMSGQ